MYRAAELKEDITLHEGDGNVHLELLLRVDLWGSLTRHVRRSSVSRGRRGGPT